MKRGRKSISEKTQRRSYRQAVFGSKIVRGTVGARSPLRARSTEAKVNRGTTVGGLAHTDSSSGVRGAFRGATASESPTLHPVCPSHSSNPQTRRQQKCEPFLPHRLHLLFQRAQNARVFADQVVVGPLTRRSAPFVVGPGLLVLRREGLHRFRRPLWAAFGRAARRTHAWRTADGVPLAVECHGARFFVEPLLAMFAVAVRHARLRQDQHAPDISFPFPSPRSSCRPASRSAARGRCQVR